MDVSRERLKGRAAELRTWFGEPVDRRGRQPRLNNLVVIVGTLAVVVLVSSAILVARPSQAPAASSATASAPAMAAASPADTDAATPSPASFVPPTFDAGAPSSDLSAFGTDEPVEAPTPTLPPAAGHVAAKVASKIDCDAFNEQFGPEVVGDYIVIQCGGSDHIRVYVVDARSGKLLSKFVFGDTTTIWKVLFDRYLWFSDLPAGGCVDSCNFTSHVYRLDPKTGKYTAVAKGSVETDAFGYVWALAEDGKHVIRIDPATSQTTTMPWPGGDTVAAGCGALWSFDGLSGKVSAVDPSNGAVISTFAGQTQFRRVYETAAGCLAADDYGDLNLAARGLPASWTIDAYPITMSGLGAKGTIPYPPYPIMDFDGTYWKLTCGSNEGGCWESASIQRIDPGTGKPSGPSYDLPAGPLGDAAGFIVISAGGSFWVYNSSELVRLSSPLQPGVPAATPPPSATPAPTPTPEPTATAEPSPTPAPTPAPTPTDAPAPTPTEAATPTPAS